jgi:hypothetical protein
MPPLGSAELAVRPGDVHTDVHANVHTVTSLARPRSLGRRPNGIPKCSSSLRRVRVRTSLWTSATTRKRMQPVARAVKVGVAERDTCGPRGLEGPDRCTDTMDVDGPLGPAWTTPLSLLPTSSTTASPQGTGDTAWGTLPHRRCNCVTNSEVGISHKIRGSGLCRVDGMGFS